MSPLTLALTRVLFGALDRARSQDRERGDVPGWVLITIMTAGIVTVLWAVAEPTLRDLMSDALDSVSGPGD